MYLRDESNVRFPEEDFLIKKIKKNHYAMLEAHTHNQYEINYILSGARYYFIRNERYLLTSGSFIFIDRNELHRSMDAEPTAYEKIHIDCGLDFLRRMQHIDMVTDLTLVFRADRPVLHVGGEEKAFAEHLLFRMMYELKHRYEGFETEVALLMVQLLRFAIRRPIHTDQKYISPLPLQERVRDMLQYLNRNFTAPLTLQHLSERYHFNATYLSSLFRKTTGFSLVEYINGIRVKEAKALLAHTDRDIATIGLDVGFNSPTHFNRIFKGVTGMTPSSFRRSVQV